MISIEKHIQNFDVISLEELNQLALLTRTDRKFTLNIADLEEILFQIEKEYKILAIEGFKNMQYKTIYLDTPSFDLFRMHHNGKLNRYKIRIREYLQTNTRFFETKFKNNKGVTIKKRYNKADGWDYNQLAKNFVEENTNIKANKLKKGLEVYCKRCTFANIETGERVTIDTELEYILNNKSTKMENLVIIEVKSKKGSRLSPILRALRDKRVQAFGISKYCFGIALLSEGVKKNMFKKKVLHLKKLNSAK